VGPASGSRHSRCPQMESWIFSSFRRVLSVVFVALSCVSLTFFGWPPYFTHIACGEEKEGDTCEEKQKRPG